MNKSKYLGNILQIYFKLIFNYLFQYYKKIYLIYFFWKILNNFNVALGFFWEIPQNVCAHRIITCKISWGFSPLGIFQKNKIKYIFL